MTVLVYRDGILASDSGAFRSNLKSGLVRKVIKNKKAGFIAGGAGPVFQVEAFLKFMEERKEDDISKINFDELTGCEEIATIIVDKAGNIFTFEGGFTAYRIDTPFIADGSGHEVATGALAMGATAEQAVAITIEHHTKCTGPIQVVKI